MGLDIAMFVGAVDDEFLCSICKMVVENAVQSPCEHIFCGQCILKWLAIRKSCPVDQSYLNSIDIRPLPRYFRNLLDKMEVRCQFEGCQIILPVEHLQNHRANCVYHPNAKVLCDLGCNLTITRSEYKETDCLAHLTKRVRSQQEELTNLGNLFRRQKEDMISRHEEEIATLRHEICCQIAEIAEINYKSHQREMVALFFNDLSQSNNKWKNCLNMNISSHPPIILEQDNFYGNSFAQFSKHLDPANLSFKMRILNIGANNFIGIGLAHIEHPFHMPPGVLKGSIGYYSNGTVAIDEQYSDGKEWKNGDVIECGIKFDHFHFGFNFMQVEVYVSLNQQLIVKKVLQMPPDGLYPTVSMRKCSETMPKVEFLRNLRSCNLHLP